MNLPFSAQDVTRYFTIYGSYVTFHRYDVLTGVAKSSMDGRRKQKGRRTGVGREEKFSNGDWLICVARLYLVTMPPGSYPPSQTAFVTFLATTL